MEISLNDMLVINIKNNDNDQIQSIKVLFHIQNFCQRKKIFSKILIFNDMNNHEKYLLK